jgi:hypothetical protein
MDLAINSAMSGADAMMSIIDAGCFVCDGALTSVA